MTALRDKSFFLQERNIFSMTKNMKEVRFILEIAQLLMYLKILNLELMIQKIKRNFFLKMKFTFSLKILKDLNITYFKSILVKMNLFKLIRKTVIQKEKLKFSLGQTFFEEN